MGEPPPTEEPKPKDEIEETELFEILEYTPTVQKNILDRMAPKELLLLYFSSEEGRNLIETKKLKRNKKWIIIRYTEFEISIEANEENNEFSYKEEACILNCLLHAGSNTMMIENTLKTFEEDDLKFHYCQSCTISKNPGIFVESGACVYRIVNWLKRIFNTELVSLTLAMVDGINNRVILSEMRYSEDAFKFLSTKFPVYNTSPKVDEKFIEDVIKSPETKTLEMCTNVRGYEYKYYPDAEFTNNVLNLWQQHCNPGLKYITIGYKNGRLPPANVLKLDEIFENFETIKDGVDGNLTMVTEEFSRRRNEMRNAVDIRSASGRLATAEMDTDRLFPKFCLYIWD